MNNSIIKLICIKRQEYNLYQECDLPYKETFSLNREEVIRETFEVVYTWTKNYLLWFNPVIEALLSKMNPWFLVRSCDRTYTWAWWVW